MRHMLPCLALLLASCRPAVVTTTTPEGKVVQVALQPRFPIEAVAPKNAPVFVAKPLPRAEVVKQVAKKAEVTAPVPPILMNSVVRLTHGEMILYRLIKQRRMKNEKLTGYHVDEDFPNFRRQANALRKSLVPLAAASALSPVARVAFRDDIRESLWLAEDGMMAYYDTLGRSMPSGIGGLAPTPFGVRRRPINPVVIPRRRLIGRPILR